MACSSCRTMTEPDLRDLDLFAAVARTRNFRRAAVEIRVSVSSLSQRLRDLEERLGVRLMNRTTRSVALTEAGELLLSRVAPALRDVDVVSESGFVDIVSGGYDAGVRYGEHLAQDMVAIPLSGPQHYVVVASPDYLARRGKPEHPKDLLDHDCIRARYSSGVMHDWEFEKAGQIVKVDPPAKLISTNMGLSMRAALDGLIQDWCEPFPGPFLYYPSRRQTPPALRAFIDFVADWRKRETRSK